MSLQPWRKGIVINIAYETSDTKRFWVEVPELECIDFKPGQFVTLDLPIHEKANKRWRSYSIASSPDGTNVFELLVVLDKLGLGTPYLFDEVKIGSELKFRGPQGVFYLKEPIETDLFLICTGTGVAPLRSMINYIASHQVPHKNIYLIFGCRDQASLLYESEFRMLEHTLHGFHYLPTLSRENWDGYTGYVHTLYEKLCEQKLPAQFYLCGWKGMVDEARIRIHQLGYAKHDIHVEIYG